MQPQPPPTSPLPARMLSTLLRRYGAGETLSCEPVAQGLLNRGYRVTTNRGHFFLKHHLDGDPAAIDRQHRATARLGVLGLPVAPPVPDPEGHTVSVVAGRCLALHPWVEGRHRDGGELSHVQSWRLGDLLGLVHTGLAKVMGGGATPHRTAAAPDAAGATPRRAAGATAEAAPAASAPAAPSAAAGTAVARSTAAASEPPATAGAAGATAGANPGAAPVPVPGADAAPLPGTPLPSADPGNTDRLIDELLARVRARRPRDGFDMLSEHRLLERRELLWQHAHRRPDEGTPPITGWVHGDFHPLNLIYRRNGPVEPVAIVDWDRLGVQPRAEEAVRAAAIFFVRPDGTLELPKVRAYARAYRRAAGADADELGAAVHRVWWERLNDFWMLRWRYELGDCRTDAQFPAAAALVVWWTRRYDAVREAFCG